MSKELSVGFESGLQCNFLVKDAEFHVFPPTIPEGEPGAGEPHPKAGQLSSYRIDTSDVDEDVDIIWFKIDKIESIVLTRDLDAVGNDNVSTE